jgi:hypothetical protein
LSGNCRSRCATQDHSTFGECARAAQIQIDKHGLQHRSAEQEKDQLLDRYASLRKAGEQPATLSWPAVRHAEERGGEAA